MTNAIYLGVVGMLHIQLPPKPPNHRLTHSKGVGGVGTAFLEQLGQLASPPKLILLARSTQSLLALEPA